MDEQQRQPSSGNTPSSSSQTPTGTNPSSTQQSTQNQHANPQHQHSHAGTQQNSQTHQGGQHQHGAHAQNQHQNTQQQSHHQQPQHAQQHNQQSHQHPKLSQDPGEPKGIGKLGGMFDDFIKQSERVINVTHKPGRDEFKQIAMSTAIGMAVVGVIGYVIAMTAFFLKSAISGA